jgi:hypothetical protein
LLGLLLDNLAKTRRETAAAADGDGAARRHIWPDCGRRKRGMEAGDAMLLWAGGG